MAVPPVSADAREPATASAGKALSLLRGTLLRGVDTTALGITLLGLAVLYGPTYWGLANGLWASDEQSFGPILLATSAWLFWRERAALASLPGMPRVRTAYALLGFGLVLYALGRSQDILMLEVGSQIVVIAALLLMFKGTQAVKLMWVQLALLAFLVPLPGDLVAAVTGPLKSAVSAAAAAFLHWLGYPVGRSGVMLSVGQYQLMVADACAGLNSIITLEALGLIYMKMMNHTSTLRNTALAILILPISFCANTVRVIVLVLVTYHLGDEAGQGFIHGAAGLVLFLVATVLMIFTDGLLGWGLAFRPGRKPVP